jgi:prepilin-type N-terminal cleavage/methylation domain-containing protein
MNRSARHGMTLIEMLVATAMTLIIMGVVAQLFGFMALTLSRSRDSLEMSADARSVANLLRRDLSGLTVKTVPPTPADADGGYLEIIEGAGVDKTGGFNQLTGDCDDVLMFTTRSLDQPFVGRYGTGSIESPVAEVVWYCRRSPTAYQTVAGSKLYTLYRRQLLVMDYVGQTPFEASGDNSLAASSLPNTNYDISLRADGSLLRPNSLGDLTRREWRFMHILSGSTSRTAFPYDNTVTNLAASGPLTGTRQGEDIVLTNVLAFDIRVFDPRAPLKATITTAVDPGDPGYNDDSTASTGVSGAYVDLGSGAAATTLMGSATTNSQLTAIYDTWSTHYESNGIDEDGVYGADQGTNGKDDDTSTSAVGYGIMDDATEQETSPPYPVALRGLEIRIRVYEPSSRQVRQVTVRHTFVPH